MAKAMFSTGCFWCGQPPFESLSGVTDVVVGYAGAEKREAVVVIYDEQRIGFSQLLDTFWRNIDPTDPGGQFFDRGSKYTTAIYYATDDERDAALISRKELEQSGMFSAPLVTQILPWCEFVLADEAHQSYHRKNPEHYRSYKVGSGREAYFKRMWGK